MVGLFLRLKWRLLRNGFRRGRAGRVNAILTIVLTLAGGSLGGLGLFALAAGREEAWIPGLFSLLFFVWVVSPIVAFGTDETLDPARLAMLPLRRRQLLPGLLAASMLSAGGIGSLLLVAGPALAAQVGIDGAPADAGSQGVVVLGCLVVVAMSIAASRLATTALSTLLRSRRGRDLAITLSMVGGFVIYGLTQLPSILGPSIGNGQRLPFNPESTWGAVAWLPPGQAGLAVARGLRGEGPSALGHMLVAVGWTAAFLLVWGIVLRRLQETPGSEGGRTRVRLGLVPGFLAWLPASRTTAVMARELRYLGRHGGRRARILQQSAFLLFPMFSLLGAEQSDPRLVLVAGAIGVFAMNEPAIQYGSDGAALWSHLAAPGSWRADMLGRNLAALVLEIPIGALAIGVTAVLTGGWQYVLPAAALVPVGWMLATALGNVLAVTFPFPIPDATKGNVFGQASGQRPGCVFGLLTMLGLFVLLIVMGLLETLLWLRADQPLFLVAGTLTGLCVAGALWLISIARTADAAQRRGPEILEAVIPR